MNHIMGYNFNQKFLTEKKTREISINQSKIEMQLKNSVLRDNHANELRREHQLALARKLTLEQSENYNDFSRDLKTKARKDTYLPLLSERGIQDEP